MKEKTQDYLLITAGTLIMGAGIYFFKFPNNFSTGGVSAISIMLHALIPSVSAGTFVLALNMILLLIGFLVFGKSFGVKTAYSSILLSVFLWGAEKIYPLSGPLTDQPFMELIYSVMLPAVGSAILFNRHATSGGTDIVAMILKKYTHIETGHALFISDIIIASSSCFIFGIKTGLFSIFGLFMKALVVDNVIENINLSKHCVIITDNPGPICDFINNKLNRGATVLDGTGAFTHQNKEVIITILKRNQAFDLRMFIKKNDPSAFIIISNTSEIVGKGFRETID